MARMIVITLLAILALLLPARAIDLSKSKNIQLEFADTDVVPKTALVSRNIRLLKISCLV
jgi:hypothetical protein